MRKIIVPLSNFQQFVFLFDPFGHWHNRNLNIGNIVYFKTFIKRNSKTINNINCSVNKNIGLAWYLLENNIISKKGLSIEKKNLGAPGLTILY